MIRLLFKDTEDLLDIFCQIVISDGIPPMEFLSW